MDNVKLLYDPMQIKEFGGSYFERDGMSYRYQQSKKLFWKAKYIPYGPICSTMDDLDTFLNSAKSSKFERIHVDLPLILDEKLKSEIKEKFINAGFQISKYVQDDETILINRENASIDNKEVRYYVRKSEPEYNVSIVTNFDENTLIQVYKVYEESAQRIGFIARSIDVFRKLEKNMITAIAVNKTTGEIDGFVLGAVVPVYKDYKNKVVVNTLQIIFIGTNEQSRKAYIGYALHKMLFQEAFEKHNIDIIDFRGASRTMDRKYLAFKKSFGGEFYSFGGSFKLTRYF